MWENKGFGSFGGKKKAGEKGHGVIDFRKGKKGKSRSY